MDLIEILKYIVLGIIQGITEIFPVSSSGHLTIFTQLFGLNTDNLTIFLMITNTGSFLALVVYFYKDIGKLIHGTWRFIIRRDDVYKDDFIYVLKLIVAVIPIGIFGIIIKKYLPDDLLLVGISLLVTGGLLFYVYKMKDIQWRNEISWKNALIIGAFQMFGVFPGISRSGITMIGGLTQKIELKKVLRFSFLSYILISIPVMILGFYDASQATESINYVGYALAFVMSFIFSLLAIRFLYRYVHVKNLVYFAVYCILIGVVSIILKYTL